jgi:hypothetical protein
MSAEPKMEIEGMLEVEESGVWGEEVVFPSVIQSREIQRMS